MYYGQGKPLRIEVHRLFRYGMSPKDRLHPGIYRVPEDVDRDTAQLAVAGGFASILTNKKEAAPENKQRGNVPESK